MYAVKYIVHSDINENNIYDEFDNREEAIAYAKDNAVEQTFVDAVAVELNDFGEVVDEYGSEVIWSYEDGETEKDITEETHAQFAKPEGNRVAAYNNAVKYAQKNGIAYIYGYTDYKGKFFALDNPIPSKDPTQAEKTFKGKYKNSYIVYMAYPDSRPVNEEMYSKYDLDGMLEALAAYEGEEFVDDDDVVIEDYTGTPEERTDHLDYVDDNLFDYKAKLPKNISKDGGNVCKINKAINHPDDTKKELNEASDAVAMLDNLAAKFANYDVAVDSEADLDTPFDIDWN